MEWGRAIEIGNESEKSFRKQEEKGGERQHVIEETGDG